MATTNLNTHARLFVEKFLQDQGAEAADLFKCDLENAIEKLLTEVVKETKDVAEANQRPLVWLKPKPVAPAVVVHTLRSWSDELATGRTSAKA